MCFASGKSHSVDRQNSPFAQNSGTFCTVGGGALGCDNKIFGAIVTSLFALYVGMSRLNMAVYVDQSSKPLACGLFLVLAIRKLIQKGTRQVGSLVENCSQKVDDVMMRVSSNSTLTRIKSSMSASSMRLMDLATGRMEAGGGMNRFEFRLPKIAILQSPFLSVETTAGLTLGDIKDLFRYSLEMNRSDFDRELFVSELNSVLCIDAICAMDHIVLAARGCTPAKSSTSLHDSRSDASDMDALYFVAVVCIFAEWRSMRLVPPGHHRYSIGMGLARRDLIQNAQKIELAVQLYMFNQVQSRLTSYHSSNMISSPTLRQLMLWEIEQKFHPRLPKVREKSGASGLLWICRQLKYQNLIFQNILQVPLVHSTAKMAVTAAYTSTYEAYHGFLVKQVFLSSFDAAPSADEILNHMIPSIPVKELVDSSMRNSYVTDESTNCAIDGGHSLVTKPAPPSRNPFELIGSHFLSEWIKFERFLNQCNGIHAESSASRNGLLVPAKNCSVIDFKNVELFVSSTDKNPLSKESFSINMVEEEIVSFNGTIQPILSELDLLIDTLGINDPSKC